MTQRIAPQEVDFSKLLPLGIQGSSRMRSFQPNNGNSFNATNSIINVPLNSTGWLDTQHSYLHFTLTLAGTGNIGFDGSAQAVIKTLRLIGSNGEELERIDEYNVVQAAFCDLQASTDHSNSHLNAMERQTLTVGQPATAAAPASYDVSIKLMSALLNCDKYLPLGWLSGGGLSIEITLDTYNNALFQAAGNTDATYTVTNVQYNAQIVETSTEFNEAFSAMLQRQGGVQWHGTTTRSYQTSITGPGTQYTVSVASRLKSIKSLFTILRPENQFGATPINQTSISQRCLCGLNKYSVKVGSKTYPQQPLTKVSEMFAETVKAIGPLGDCRSANRMNYANYARSAYTLLAAGNVASGFIGIDYETYAQASSILESGLDTASQSLPINIELGFPVGPAAGVCKVTNVALVDVIFTLDSQGLISASM